MSSSSLARAGGAIVPQATDTEPGPRLSSGGYFQGGAAAQQRAQNLSEKGRHFVLRHVRRKAAGVPVVSTHGPRGTHASLAMAAGADGDLVAAPLGHESFTTTERHDARPDAIAPAQQSGALRELSKSSCPFRWAA